MRNKGCDPFVKQSQEDDLQNLLITFFILFSVVSTATLDHGTKVLEVGKELWRETLLLQMGSRLYRLQGLKSYTWYEVKISYPASIPASFSIQLNRGDLESGPNRIRRLLNTEKLIFRTDGIDADNYQNGMYVLVTVEPEGVVAIPHVREREFIIFNIVCDELLLGIPHKAWWVGALVLFCLAVAVIIPRFLPAYLLPKTGSSPPHHNLSKES